VARLGILHVSARQAVERKVVNARLLLAAVVVVVDVVDSAVDADVVDLEEEAVVVVVVVEVEVEEEEVVVVLCATSAVEPTISLLTVPRTLSSATHADVSAILPVIALLRQLAVKVTRVRRRVIAAERLVT